MGFHPLLECRHHRVTGEMLDVHSLRTLGTGTSSARDPMRGCRARSESAREHGRLGAHCLVQGSSSLGIPGHWGLGTAGGLTPTRPCRAERPVTRAALRCIWIVDHPEAWRPDAVAVVELRARKDRHRVTGHEQPRALAAEHLVGRCPRMHRKVIRCPATAAIDEIDPHAASHLLDLPNRGWCHRERWISCFHSSLPFH